MSSFIDDGYTAPAIIEEAEGLYDRTEFSFRPQLPRERALFWDAQEKAAPDKAEDLVDAMLAKHVVSWNYDRDCKSPASYRKMQPSLRVRMVNIVCGLAPTGVKKDAGKEEADPYLASLNDAAAGSPAPGDVQLAADAKNSATG